MKLSLRRRVQLEVKGDKWENRVLVSVAARPPTDRPKQDVTSCLLPLPRKENSDTTPRRRTLEVCCAHLVTPCDETTRNCDTDSDAAYESLPVRRSLPCCHATLEGSEGGKERQSQQDNLTGVTRQESNLW